MAVVVARMVAQLEAETSSFHARMTAAETQLTRWNNSTTAGRRGVMVLNNALQQLSFQAAGLPGPLGKVASAVGILGLGTGPVMVAVAALGALAVVFDRAAKSAEEFVKEATRVREFQQSHVAMLAGIGPAPQLTRGERILEMEKQLAGALKQQEALGPARFGLLPLKVGEDPTERARQANREFNALTVTVNNLTRALRELRIEEAEAQRKQKLADIIFQQDQILLERGGVFQALRPGFQAGPFGVQTGGALGLPAPSGPTFANIRANVPRFVAPDTASKAGFKMTPEFAIMSSMALLQGAQGGPAGLFGAAAGPVAMINPLAGAITAGIGGIFSLFDNSEERRHRALMDKLDKLGQEVGLDRVTVVFTGPDGHQIRKSLAELEEGDAVERVPGPVGAGG